MKTIFGNLKRGEDLLILESGVIKDSGFICALTGELFKETREVVKVRYIKIKDLNQFLLGQGTSESIDDISKVGSVDFEHLQKNQEALTFVIDSTFTFTLQFIFSAVALLNAVSNTGAVLSQKIERHKDELLQIGISQEELDFFQRYPQVMSVVGNVLSLISKDYGVIISLLRRIKEES